MPVKLLDKATKQVVEIPESDVPDALATGNFMVDNKTQYNLVNEDGETVGAVPGAQLHGAFQKGLRLETPEESSRRAYASEMNASPGASKNADKYAFVAGIGRGLTLGLSDLVATESGLVDPAYLESLREHAPTTSKVGEVGGFALGALLTAGGNAEAEGAIGAAKLLPSAGVSALGRAVSGGAESLGLKVITGAADSFAKRAAIKALSLTAAGAVEGSLVGVGQAITEESLGDPRTFGELLAATVGPSAAIGGIAGGLFGAATELGGEALAKLARRSEKGFADAIGEEVPAARRAQTLKAMGLNARKAAKLGEDKISDAVDTLLDPNILDDAKPIIDVDAKVEENLARATKAVKQTGRNIDAYISGFDDLAAQMDQAPIHEEAQFAQAHGLEGEFPNVTRRPLAADDLPQKKTIIDGLEKLKEEWQGKTAYKAGIAKINEIQQDLAADEQPFTTFRDMQEQKVSFRQGARKTVPGESIPKGSPKDAYSHAEAFAAQELEAAVDRMAVKLDSQELYVDYLRQKEIYAALTDLSKMGNKEWQKVGDSYINEVLEAGKEYFKGLAWRMIYSGRSAGSAAMSAAKAMGLRKVGENLGDVGGKALDYIQPSRITRYATDAAKLRQVQIESMKFAQDVEKKVDKLLKLKVHQVTGQPAVRILNDLSGKRDEQEAWKHFRSHIANLSDPNKLATNIGMTFGGLEKTAPNITYEASATLTRAVQAIQQAMPAETPGATLQPLLEDYTPDPNELSDLKIVTTAALKPESILEDLKQGSLTPKAVQTVAMVYPQFYDLLKQTISEKVSKLKELIPYNTRVQLAILFDLPTDPTLAQDFVQRSQLAWAPQGPPPSAKGSPPKLDPDSARKLFDKKAFQTPSQRIEGGVG
jgi:hypothetical protein